MSDFFSKQIQTDKHCLNSDSLSNIALKLFAAFFLSSVGSFGLYWKPANQNLKPIFFQWDLDEKNRLLLVACSGLTVSKAIMYHPNKVQSAWSAIKESGFRPFTNLLLFNWGMGKLVYKILQLSALNEHVWWIFGQETGTNRLVYRPTRPFSLSKSISNRSSCNVASKMVIGMEVDLHLNSVLCRLRHNTRPLKLI